MMAERYPHLKEEVGNSIPSCKISSLLDIKNLLGGQLPPVLWRWHVGLLSQKKKKEKKDRNSVKSHVSSEIDSSDLGQL